MSDALSFADIHGQRVELLPARIVLTTSGYSDDGGDGGDGGDYNTGGDGGKGGDGGDAYAKADHNYNSSYWGDAKQENVAVAVAGDGGDANGGDVDADGGDGGRGGDDY